MHLRAIAACAAAAATAALVTTAPTRGQDGVKPDPTSVVVDRLDNLVQPRFRRLDLGFGVTDRLLRAAGHNAVRLRADTPDEKRLLAEANAANRDYVVAFLHCVHVPATAYRSARGQTVRVGRSPGARADSPMLRFVAAREVPGAARGGYQTYSANSAVWQRAAVKSLPSLMHGRPVEVSAGGWLQAMRPVRASSSECLSCHTQSKQGDTLGAMVYLVRKQPDRR